MDNLSNTLIFNLLKESEVTDFEKKYPSLHTGFEYSSNINAVREAWTQGIESSDVRLKNLTQSIIVQPLDYHHDLEGDVKNLISLLHILKKSSDFEKYFLLGLKNLIKSSEISDAYFEKGNFYQEKYQEKVKVLYVLFADSIDPRKLDLEILNEIILLTLVPSREDYEMVNNLLMLRPDVLNFINKEGKPLIYKAFELYPYKISSGALNFLLEKVKEVNVCRKGVDPLVVLLAKNSREAELRMIANHLRPGDLESLDEEGCTAYYYLLRLRHFKNETLDFFETLCPDRQGLSNIVVNYLSMRPKEIEEDVPIHLEAFIHAWKLEKSSQNYSALKMATQVFIDKMGARIFKLNDLIPRLNELIKLMKEDPYFEVSVSKIISCALNESSQNASLILNSIKENLNSERLSNSETIRLINKALKIESEANDIADILLGFAPQNVNVSYQLSPYQNKKSTMLFDAVQHQNLFAITYLLKKGALLEEGLLHLAVEKGNTKILKLLIENNANINEKNIEGDTPLHRACKKGDLEIVKCLLDAKDVKLGELNNDFLIPLQIAQLNKHYDTSGYLFSMFGPDQFKSLYNAYKFIMKNTMGIEEDKFSPLAFYEYRRCQQAKEGYMFDIGILTTLSATYEKEFSHSNISVDYPKGSPIDFLPIQEQICKQFLADERTKEFSFKEIWRYGIDFDKQEKGPFAFENEPGYIRSFLEGMHFALISSIQLKTADWYLELHARITEHTSKFLLNKKWNPSALSLVSIPQGVRNRATTFSISQMDRDDLGSEDLRDRYPEVWESGLEFNSPNQLPGEMTKRLNHIFEYFQTQYELCENRAEKLILFLATVRELEIVHIFSDANGRASNLALLSMVMGEKDLPAFILADPNCFDGNGPESLCTRFLEGCLNFKKNGIEPNYKRRNNEKKLDSLDLEGYQDLIVLREELKPLVENKLWNAFPLYNERTPLSIKGNE